MSLIGQAAPRWHLRALDEAPPAHPIDLKGRPLLLLFFSVGCPGCKSRAIPLSLNVRKVYPEVQLAAIHTSIDGLKYSPAQIEGVRQLLRIPYPIWIDEGNQTFHAYQAEGTPHWVLIDAEGIVQKSIFGSMPDAQARLDYSLREMMEG